MTQIHTEKPSSDAERDRNTLLKFMNPKHYISERIKGYEVLYHNHDPQNTINHHHVIFYTVMPHFVPGINPESGDSRHFQSSFDDDDRALATARRSTALVASRKTILNYNHGINTDGMVLKLPGGADNVTSRNSVSAAARPTTSTAASHRSPSRYGRNGARISCTPFESRPATSPVLPVLDARPSDPISIDDATFNGALDHTLWDDLRDGAPYAEKFIASIEKQRSAFTSVTIWVAWASSTLESVARALPTPNSLTVLVTAHLLQCVLETLPESSKTVVMPLYSKLLTGIYDNSVDLPSPTDATPWRRSPTFSGDGEGFSYSSKADRRPARTSVSLPPTWLGRCRALADSVDYMDAAAAAQGCLADAANVRARALAERESLHLRKVCLRLHFRAWRTAVQRGPEALFRSANRIIDLRLKHACQRDAFYRWRLRYYARTRSIISTTLLDVQAATTAAKNAHEERMAEMRSHVAESQDDYRRQALELRTHFEAARAEADRRVDIAESTNSTNEARLKEIDDAVQISSKRSRHWVRLLLQNMKETVYDATAPYTAPSPAWSGVTAEEVTEQGLQSLEHAVVNGIWYPRDHRPRLKVLLPPPSEWERAAQTAALAAAVHRSLEKKGGVPSRPRSAHQDKPRNTTVSLDTIKPVAPLTPQPRVVADPYDMADDEAPVPPDGMTTVAPVDLVATVLRVDYAVDGLLLEWVNSCLVTAGGLAAAQAASDLPTTPGIGISPSQTNMKRISSPSRSLSRSVSRSKLSGSSRQPTVAAFDIPADTVKATPSPGIRHVVNFSSDWADGEVFATLLNFLAPRVFPAQLFSNTSVHQRVVHITTALTKLGIVDVITPADIMLGIAWRILVTVGSLFLLFSTTPSVDRAVALGPKAIIDNVFGRPLPIDGEDVPVSAAAQYADPTGQCFNQLSRLTKETHYLNAAWHHLASKVSSSLFSRLLSVMRADASIMDVGSITEMKKYVDIAAARLSDILPSKNVKGELAALVDVLKMYYKELLGVFTYYTSSENAFLMSDNAFWQFCKDSGIAKAMQPTVIEQIFYRVVNGVAVPKERAQIRTFTIATAKSKVNIRSSAASGNENMFVALTPGQFSETVVRLSCAYGKQTKDKEFKEPKRDAGESNPSTPTVGAAENAFSPENIMPNETLYLGAQLRKFMETFVVTAMMSSIDAFRAAIAASPVQRVLGRHDKNLTKAFRLYARDSFKSEGRCIGLSSWMKLLTDAAMFDASFTQGDATGIFIHVQENDGVGESQSFMDFGEWMVGMIAVAASKIPAPYLNLEHRVDRFFNSLFASSSPLSAKIRQGVV